MAIIRRIRTVWSGVAGSPWYTNMYFTRVIGTEDDAINAIATFWNAADAYISTTADWEVQGVIDLVDDATGQLTGTETGTPVTGAGASAAELLPLASQVCVNWFTDLFTGGRRVRGKTFVPGLTEVINDAGAPAAAARGVISTAAAELIADTSVTGPLRVYSPTNGLSSVVTSTTVMPAFAVLRSRRD